eukprot:Hpha_TRINITY_DN16272_c0_g1::TRINITY_DN16272_c0_g1_i2::g.12507::m.12507
MGGCCRWGWLVRQGDTPDEAKIKTIGFPFCVFLFLVNLFTIGVLFLQSRYETMRIIGNAMAACACLQFMGAVLWTRIPAGYLADVLLMVTIVGICSLDIAHAVTSYAFRAWTFAVLVLDIALVFKRYHMPLFMIPFVLVYLAA